MPICHHNVRFRIIWQCWIAAPFPQPACVFGSFYTCPEAREAALLKWRCCIALPALSAAIIFSSNQPPLKSRSCAKLLPPLLQRKRLPAGVQGSELQVFGLAQFLFSPAVRSGQGPCPVCSAGLLMALRMCQGPPLEKAFLLLLKAIN